MATAGLYDDSGKWLYRTGLPGKSGVGGGVHRRLAREVRDRGSLAPPLDDAGNSVKAQKAIADISNALAGTPTHRRRGSRPAHRPGSPAGTIRRATGPDPCNQAPRLAGGANQLIGGPYEDRILDDGRLRGG